MKSYDLRNEPWIPVLMAEADLRTAPDSPVQLMQVSLRDLFKEAHRIREVHGDTPMETIALNRFLLAVAIDAYTPGHEKDADKWFAIWEAGRFSGEAIDAYLNREDNRDCFDLFHPERPFYQHPKPLAKEASALSKLFMHETSGNNATLFSHDMDTQDRIDTPARLAVGLITCQSCAVGGGVSVPFNLSHGPMVGAAHFWLRGKCLAEALLLNAPPDDEVRMISHVLIGNTQPLPSAWRQVLPKEHSKRPVTGIIDLLTWQSRRLTLHEKEGLGYGVYLTQGHKDEPVCVSDPHKAYRMGDNGPFSLKISYARTVWRDIDTVLSARSGASSAGGPTTFKWLQRNGRRIGLRRNEAIGAEVFIMDTDKAKIEYVGQEPMPLHPVLVGQAEAVKYAALAKEHAEQQRNILNDAIKEACKYVLAAPKAGDDKAGSPDPNAVNNLAQSFGAEANYWSAMNTHFPILLQKFADILADEPDSEEASEQMTLALMKWSEELFDIAKTTYKKSTAHLTNGTAQLRARAMGQSRLRRVKALVDFNKENQNIEA